MKKVLSFVLVLSMILGSFGMAFAAPAADVVGKDYEDAVNVLTELGVVAGYEDGTYRPENVVTRAEMATFIVKAMGLADYAVGKSEFSDMAGHWADPFVAYAVSLGFVKGNTDGTFAPNAPVTYDQAITMLVQAVGYKAEYMTGGYPGAFVNQAKTLGMLDGVKSGVAGANRGDVATLLFNTLDVRFVRYTNDGALDTTAMGTADNMLKRLGAGEYVGVANPSGGAFTVLANGSEKSVINLKEYQGARVEAYANADGEIIAVKEVISVFLTGDLDKADENGVFTTSDDVEYKMDNVAATEFVSFENGSVTSSAVTYGALSTTEEGITIAVEITGKYITKIFSMAKWNDGTTVKWDDDMAEELAEDDKIGGYAFVMDENDEIDMDEVAFVGVTSLDEIKKDDIVTYYLNGSNKIVKVAVCDDVIEGKITKTSADEYFLNGKYYEAAKIGDSDNIELGAEGKFYLDAAGKIVYAKAVTVKAEDFAIIADRENGTEGLRGDAALVKLILEDGSAKTYDINKDAIEDGKLASTANANTTVASIGAVETELATGSVIKFHVNAAGEVDKVATVAALATSAAANVSAKGTYNGEKIAADAVILGMKGLTTNGSLSVKNTDYEVIERSALLGQKDVVAHYLVDDGEIVFMVIKLEGVTGTHKFAVSTKVAELAVAEGEDPLYEVTMLVNGEEKVYTSETRLNNYATIYAIDFDANGYVKTVTVEADEFAEITGLGFTTGGGVTIDGAKVYHNDAYKVTLDADVVVYKHNAETGKFAKGKVADIKNYANTIKMFDVDDDKVADIVLLEAAVE